MATKKAKEFRPSDGVMRYIDFARFCVKHGIEAYDVAELVTLAERAFKAGERLCNSGSDRDNKASERTGEAFEAKAKALGFEVTWPGLWPQLMKADADGVMLAVYLPTFKD
jgi:hypothetical protein